VGLDKVSTYQYAAEGDIGPMCRSARADLASKDMNAKLVPGFTETQSHPNLFRTHHEEREHLR
jgi:hypothetical protein